MTSVILKPMLAMNNNMSTYATSKWSLLPPPGCHVESIARVLAWHAIALSDLFAGPGLVIYTHGLGVGYSRLHVLRLALLNKLHQLGLFSPHRMASVQGASLVIMCGLSKNTPDTRARSRKCICWGL
jgi:hypothetical protein